MTKNEAIEMVLNTARNEIGYHEKASNSNLDSKTANSGSGNWTKYARDLNNTSTLNGDKNSFPWCAVFCIWDFTKVFGEETARQLLCLPQYSSGAGCLYEVQYYKQAGQWRTDPEPGDQIFFSYSAGEVSHTGIVESVANGMVNTIEGNTSDMVARRRYPLSSGTIVGYGRPRWEVVADLDAGSIEVPVVEEPAASIPTAEENAQILVKGCKGENVRKLQEDLIKLGYDVGVWGADGDFGTATYYAVKKYQQDHDLDVDGEVGPLTKASMKVALAALGALDAADAETENLIAGIQVAEADKPAVHTAAAQYRIGDVVMFAGNAHYFSPAAKLGLACKPGKAIVRAVKDGAKHPYRLMAVRGGGSTVNGWVDAGTVQAVS